VTGEALSRFPEEWQEALKEERSFRARQVFRWIHKRGILEPDAMTDLSLGLRSRLREEKIQQIAEVVSVLRAADGTRKLLVKMADGVTVECVMIPMTTAAVSDADAGVIDEGMIEEESQGETDSPSDRVTLCVSTQYGCAMGCVFCASGRAGLGRSLSAAEIVYQVYAARRYLEGKEMLTNLVFMGMGEPLHNYDATVRAIRLLSHPEGLGLGLRRMTVSTVGLVKGIARLGSDFAGKVGLALSLHAPNDALRSQLVPLNLRIPLGTLMMALRAYPLPKRRRITIEYTLFDGLNDQLGHAQELGKLLRGLPVKINLIPMNPIDQSELRGSAAARVGQFREWLAGQGYSCFVRARRGDDVSAACGQLAFRRQPQKIE
jgi:23S rRNA (adenine2503-C2)-methyltransferase